MRGNAYGDFFSTKWAWGAGKRDCHGCASQGQKERSLTGWAFADMSIYNKEEGEIRLKKFFNFFCKKY